MYVNDAFCKITGYGRDETIGRNCRFLQGADTDMAAVDRLRTAIREARHTLTLLGRRDGSRRDAGCRMFVRPDSHSLSLYIAACMCRYMAVCIV